MSQTTQLICPTLGDLPQTARQILDFAGPRRIWLLNGSLGAGKTTLVQALCRHLGVADAVLSPTFALINEYRGTVGSPVYHFDFYRLRHVNEALDMGAEEYFYSGAYCFIEWPERIVELWPEQCLRIDITVDHADQRLIKLTNL